MKSELLGIFSILGGMALFLHGLDTCQRAFSDGLGSARGVMRVICGNRFGAFIFGLILAMLTQSTTAATGFAVGLVNLGAIGLSTSMIVMMGASVGTSIIIFLISFDLTLYAPLSLAIGLGANKLGRGKIAQSGSLVVGISLVLMGMSLIKTGIEPLAEAGIFASFLNGVGHSFIGLFFVALIITATVQSSVPVLGLAVALASSGELPPSAFMPIVLGSRIGTSGLVLLTGLTGRRNAKALSIAALIYRIIGVLVLLPFCDTITKVLGKITTDLGLQVSWAQFMAAWFNVVIGLVIVHQLENFALFLVGDDDSVDQPMYLNNAVTVPDLAFPLLAREMTHLAALLDELMYLALHGEGVEAQNRVAKLAEGLPTLAEQCGAFLENSNPPERENNRREMVNLAYSMDALREMTHVICKKFPGLASQLRAGDSLPWPEKWHALTETVVKLIRQSLTALCIGQDAAFDRTMALKEAYRDQVMELRSLIAHRRVLGDHVSGDEKLLFVMDRFARCAAEVSRGETLRRSVEEKGEEALELV